MKRPLPFPHLLGGALSLLVAACRHDTGQQTKPIPQVDSVTSSTIEVRHDTAAFNKVMNAPTAPDSLPTHP